MTLHICDKCKQKLDENYIEFTMTSNKPSVEPATAKYEFCRRCGIDIARILDKEIQKR